MLLTTLSETEKISQALRATIKEQTERILSQREEVLSAFIAKYGCDPDQIEQVEVQNQDGTTTWFLRRVS